ncbi:unnamed protein product [Linum tenue]|uniref:Protein NRT1/ PTR FAMILY 4.6 n=1 Tax=Linum tenue TaxID=586396 RepID=A0AAV0S3Y2_9ROSI|nr:unnamed protein product [Linum tenue]
MEEELEVAGRWEGYVDWRNRPAIRGRHGGMLAASFVLVVEVLENLAYLANASNLVMYMSEFMHFSPSKSANNVTNFMGTSFLLALLGGFLSDAFLTAYQIYLLSAAVEFMGLVILTIQARSPSLQPPTCTPGSNSCETVHGGQAAMLFIGLYLVALGVGGIKGSLPPHGAEQFDDNTPKGRKQRSTFFNYFVFCLSTGALIAVTFVVLIAASINRCVNKTPSNAIVNLAASPCNPPPPPPPQQQQQASSTTTKESTTTENGASHPNPNPNPNPNPETLTKSLSCLNTAVMSKPFQCTVQQVEDVKVVIKVLPIFACTIMLNCCLAQLSTFSVQQAATMTTKLGSLKVPPASLPIFPVVFIMILAPIYDHFIIPFARRLTKSETGITHLQRIGVGLFLSIVAMATAALVEIKRKRVVAAATIDDREPPLPITFFWIAFQYLFLGSADLFTLAGLLEFFFSEAPASMRSLATSLSWASLAMGYYLSSVIVSVVNDVTRLSDHKPWLSGGNIDHYHLERFYWLMCVLSVLNFLHYLLWACRYKYRSVSSLLSSSSPST